MTEPQAHVLAFLDAHPSRWFRPSQMEIPNYPYSPTVVGRVLGDLVRRGLVQVRPADRGNGTTCKEYSTVGRKDTQRKLTPNPIEDRLLKAAASYLKSTGCVPVVISVDRIQGPVERDFNYELVLRFTGPGPAAAGKGARR